MKTTYENLGIWIVVQLLATEVLSIGLFSRPPLGEPIRTGLFAPIALLFFPIFAFLDGNYLAGCFSLLVDIIFLSIMAFSIVKNSRLVAGPSLFVFNVVCVVLTL